MYFMKTIPNYITHYFERERGPFKNICDLSKDAWAKLIEEEKGFEIPFNRFNMGESFFLDRCESDDLLIDLYAQKFGQEAKQRPFYATLGSFDRTGDLYRSPEKIEFPISMFEDHEATFIYEDHSHLGWLRGSQKQPDWFEVRDYHCRLFTYSELAEAFERFRFFERISSALRNDKWVSAYVEAHIWIDLDAIEERMDRYEL